MIDAREREVKLWAPTGFRLPSFDELPAGITASGRTPKRLLATYVDTDDLRLLRWGVTVRHRTDDGWTVKLPDSLDGNFLVRRELTVPGLPRRIPDEVLDLVRAYVRSATLAPQARLRTVRSVVDLRSGDRTTWGRSLTTRSRSSTGGGSPDGSANSSSRLQTVWRTGRQPPS